MNPVLNKNEARPNQDYKLMTWERFLILRKWAQTVADEHQAPVYLVGSVLEKDIPRDIDISVIFPVKVYEECFGKIPSDATAFGELMDKIHLSKPRLKAYFEGMSAIKHDTLIDLKFCPDTWWTDKDKILLASPSVDEVEQDEFKTLIEGEVKEHTNISDVIDTIENDTAFEVDAKALRYDLEHMESGETIRLRDDCNVYRY